MALDDTASKGHKGLVSTTGVYHRTLALSRQVSDFSNLQSLRPSVSLPPSRLPWPPFRGVEPFPRWHRRLFLWYNDPTRI
jgi:hypothetical protein